MTSFVGNLQYKTK